MARMKNMVISILECLNGETATRKEVWEHTQQTTWEGFKRVFGMVIAQGMIEKTSQDLEVPTWKLTEAGSKFVQSLL